MNAPAIGVLEVPGARLHHETRGAGPALLLMHGGGADAGGLERVATALAGDFRVISYDRRGFGRSPLTAPPADNQHVQTDADDAVRLLDALGSGPAHVLGSSSGAIAAIDLLSRHPDHVVTLIAHEPPLVTMLPDAAARLAFFEQVYATYRSDGVDAAMTLFMSSMGMDRPAPPPTAGLPPHVAAMLDRLLPNREFWLQHELLPAVCYAPDVDTLRAHAGKLVLAGGEESHALYPYWPNQVLAGLLGLEVVDFPGDHIGYVLHPVEFASRLTAVLSVRAADRG
jgi:pimeloyl-ACP methyl ester carboxylesterase